MLVATTRCCNGWGTCGCAGLQEDFGRMPKSADETPALVRAAGGPRFRGGRGAQASLRRSSVSNFPLSSGQPPGTCRLKQWR